MRPTESPDRQRSGLAATDEWRPGRRRATRLPTEERATQGACESSAWVRATVASKKARRTGAVQLHLYAASYGRWLLSKACHLPSPLGLRTSCWAFAPHSNFRWSSFNHGDVVENFVVARLPEAVARWVQKVVSDCRASLLKRRSQTYSPPTGCRGNSRTGPNLWFPVPRARNRATVGTRTFSVVRKRAAFPYYPLTAALPGFASSGLAVAFRADTI